jgi:putative glutamine amidotransferase
MIYRSLCAVLIIICTFFSPILKASKCRLDKSQRITVGCTYRCDFPTRIRLRASAARLGYQLELVDLSGKSSDLKNYSQIIASVDSILVPGGADIDPKFYLENVTPELRDYTNQNLHLVKFTQEGKRRDFFEYNLLKTYTQSIQQTRPLLGICRGMQMMSVVKGIPLYLDIKTELSIPNRNWKWDRVHLTDEESLLRDLLNKDSIVGFKLHHQGIRVDYFQTHRESFENVRVSAYSHSGKIAESLEYTDQPALGVQYHPEKSLPRAADGIFDWFLTAACHHKNALRPQLVVY